MKILMINKYLYPKGGAETYMLRLGACLEARGHRVEYFGMEQEQRTVGNRANAYARSVNYHGGRPVGKLRDGIASVYSAEARRKLRRVLEDFQPDACHLNNFHYQLTPAILLEIHKWRREREKICPIVYTAHDSQLVCPNHLMHDPGTGENCTKCLDGHYFHCIKGRCIHNSLAKSAVGAFAGWFWDWSQVYRWLDTVIAPSHFLAEKLAANAHIRDRIVVLPNFTDLPNEMPEEKAGEYVLYFGRYSREKGIGTLLRAVDALPEVPFVFAGSGPLKGEIERRKNAAELGFLKGEALAEVIRGARFTVVPSECLENAPFCVMESQLLGTPVLAANIGGIPELVRDGGTGELFESGNWEALAQKTNDLWRDTEKIRAYGENCRRQKFISLPQYCDVLEGYYLGEKKHDKEIERHHHRYLPV